MQRTRKKQGDDSVVQVVVVGKVVDEFVTIDSSNAGKVHPLHPISRTIHSSYSFPFLPFPHARR